MRVLILGGVGMLGHRLWIECRPRFDTFVTVRGSARAYARLGLFDADRLLPGVDVVNFDTVIHALAAAKPDVVVNCIGIVKQLEEAKNPIASLTVNSLLPHRLSELCAATGSRLIHLSTDCVFSGRKGNYSESDLPDAEDLYGRSKLLGEVAGPQALTMRTSIIGRELSTQHGLTEWLLSHRGGRVQGYTRAIFSGLTTQALARVIADVIERKLPLSGVYHVSAPAIAKHDLLVAMSEQLGANVAIERVPGPEIDRSLRSERFWSESGLMRPEWPAMLAELAAGSAAYEGWRHAGVS